MLDPAQTALVMIEFQNDWLSPEGKINHLMRDRAHFASAVATGKALLELAREQGIAVAHCGLGYQPGHPELGPYGWGLSGVIPRVTTFTQGSDGAAFGEGFEPLPGEFVVRGRTGGSGFAGSNLDAFLRANRLTQIVVAGFATNVCVGSTLRAGHDLGYNVLVVDDACAAFDRAQHDHEIAHVVHHFGRHLSLAGLRAELGQQAA